MVNSKLSIVSQEQDRPLRVDVDEIVQRNQERVVDVVRKWLLYWADLGARSLYLDDCPGISRMDHSYVVQWLRMEGFTVHTRKYWGRTVVELQAAE